MASVNLFKSDISGCDLSRYFTQTQLDDMSLVEKMIKFNKMKNYFVCQELHIECELPYFMKETLKSDVGKEDQNNLKMLPDEVKKILLCSVMPLSYLASNKQFTEDRKNENINNLNLPLCKNEDYKNQIRESIEFIAPFAIKEMEEEHKMRKKALELFRNHKIGINELRLFFPDSLESLEMAIDNISLQQDRKSRKPRYAFRKVLKKDYCEDESEDESECASDIMRSTKEELDEMTSRCRSREASFCSLDSDGSPARIKWNLPGTFAAKTIPDGLRLGCSNLPDAVLGVFAGREIKKGTIFGPYVGIQVHDENIDKTSGRFWEIFINGFVDHYIDGDDCERSNWMRYVNHAVSVKAQNLESFQYRCKIYYETVMDVPKDAELLVWYSQDYNQDHHNGSTKDKNIFKNATDKKINKYPKSKNKNIICDTSNLGDATNVKCCTKICNAKSEDRPYKCDVCCSSFAYRSHLTSHMRIHTGEKPYKCDVCGTSFAHNNSLTNHMRIHTGEKPFKCDVCGTSYATSGNLTSHMRIHTGEKPYKCDVCGTSYAHNNSLKNHMRVHTGEKVFKKP